MKGAPSAVDPVPPRTTLALVCVVVWVAAAASTRPFGIWLPMGGAAVGLGIVVFVLDRAALSVTVRPTLPLFLSGIAAGSVMAAATCLLYPLLVRLATGIAIDVSMLYAAFRAPSPTVASLALAPVVVGEELVWRGVVQPALVRRFGPWAGTLLTAVVYAVVLAPLGSPVLVGVAFSCGLAWGTLRTVTGSLVPVLVAHLLWDLLVLLWRPLISR
jgi:membrane protease YdiL (CAAX protease family)